MVREDTHTSGPTLAGLFEDQLGRRGGDVALRAPAGVLTYSQAWRRAGEVAAWLQLRGVAPGDVVALSLPRESLDLPVSVLAVLRAGATVLALDPEQPAERLRWLIEDSGAVALVAGGAAAASLPDTAIPPLRIEDAPADGAQPRAAAPAEVAYLVYTSGSTGRPKGVAMRAAALLGLMSWQREQSGPERAARTLQFAPASFDVFHQELFATFAAGGELLLVDDATRLDPRALLRFLEERRVTRMFLPFVALQQLAEAAEREAAAPAALLEVITAGEQLLATPALRAWFRRMPAARLVNQYGPAETHVVSQHVLDADPANWEELPPIGTAVDGALLLLLDEAQRPAADGEAGEIWIGGGCLAAGYHRRPELTAERFRELDAGGARGRFYRTGDLARRDARGELHFLGRADAQFKLRGHRIEPGEIEIRLCEHPDVALAAAGKREGSRGPRLVAWVVPRPGRRPTAGALRAFLEERLPSHLVPAAFVTLAELPRTATGKVDRRALPDPGRGRPELATPYVAPADERERLAAELWSELLDVDRAGVEDDFAALGGDSLTAVRMARLLGEALGREVPVTAPFRRPTIRGLLRLLDEETGECAARGPGRGRPAAPREDGVAVIGMSLRVPGAADAEEFWRMLLAGRDAIARFSAAELRAAGVAEELLADPDFVPARGCIEDALAFDAAFFGMSPREAELTDPQQRIFLEACWSALEDAGVPPDAAPGAVGVWGGMSTGMRDDSYLLRVLFPRGGVVAPGERVAAMIGNRNDYLASRVAYRLGLRGPAVAVQSACSTSLLAIAQARASLLAGECDLALAGGVSVLFPQRGGYLRQEGDIGSSDGACRPFDARADGTVFGDGVGVVVLKRLSDARADGDRILAVLRGAAVNNDGAERMGFAAPSADGQSEAVRRALADAGFDPASIGFVEAHGTATPVGDPIEVAGLRRAFGPLPPRSCALGSVKSNVGHLIAAAGVTGFAKAVLAIQHGVVPPTAHFERPHPDLGLDGTPFFVPDEPAPWPEKAGPRRAGVSSFGLGGTNVHVVLEQAPSAPADAAPRPPRVLLPVSAPDEETLARASERLARRIEDLSDADLAGVAVELQQGRSALGWRRAVVAADAAEAVARLRGAAPAGDGDRAAAAALAPRPRPASASRAAFLFPGGGAQYTGMGNELRERHPLVREILDRGLAALDPETGRALRGLWFGAGRDPEREAAAWQRPALQLPALYLLETAIARLWISWGIEPAALLGHSMGEYVAAHLAGTMTFEEGLGLVALRGRLFETLAPGAMLSVALGERELRARLGAELDLAVVNGPESCLASGPRAPLERLAAELEREGVDHAFVRIEVASHSRCVDPILAEFRDYLRGLELRPPRIPIVSNRSGDWLTEAEARSPDYWVEHLRGTVRFADGLARICSDRSRHLIEAGPGRTLTALARPWLDAASGQRAIPSMKHPQQAESEEESLLAAVGAAWCAGFAPRWDALLPAAGRRRPALPGTPFRRTRYSAGEAAADDGAGAPASRVSVPADGSAPPESAPRPAPEPAAEEEPRSRRERIRIRLAAILGDLSGLGAAALDPAKPFLEMGFDSLFLTQASLAFKREFRVKVTFRQLFDEAPTIDALATYLDERLPEGGLPSAAPRAAPTAPAPAAAGAAGPSAATPAGDKPIKFSPYKPIERGRGGGLTERQQQHLDGLIRRVLERTPKSKEITARHRRSFADPRAVAGFKTLWKEIVYPIAVDRSKGARMWDVDGNEYVDCVGGFGAILFGHAPDFLVEATERQARRNLDYGPSSPLAGELAERICRMTGMERVTFCNTGTEAVLATVRLARTVTGRDKIVTFAGDYHGLHDEVLVKLQDAGGRTVNVPAAPGIPREASANVIVLEYGDPASLETIRARAGELAAVLVEPVQSRAPELQPREFVRELRSLTEELGVPLIFDEIITGFRTCPGGAQEYYGVRADLAAYGKVIGAGMPIGVVAGRAEYMDALDGGDWSYGDDSFPEAGVTYFAGTFMRHPLALAAVAGALDVMEREGPELQAALNRRVAEFAARLNDDFERARLPLHLRHFASLIYPKWGGDPEFEDLWYHHLRLRGVHLWAGRPGFLNVMHGEAELERLRGAMLDAAEALVEGGFLVRRDVAEPATLVVPLTEAQEELWLTTRAGGGAPLALNEPCAFELRGPLCPAVLRRALRKTIARHDALRAALAADGSGLVVHSAVPEAPIELHDLSGLDELARAAERERIYRADSREPFDLSRPPLLRARLLRLAPDRHELLITVHHVVCDGWSVAILFRDLGCYYTRLLQGRNDRLEPAMQLADYLAWEREQRESDDHRQTLEFWRDRFREPPPPLELPLDAPRPETRSHRGNRLTRTIPAEVGRALQALGAERRCTLFSVLLAGYAAFLQRLTGARDLVLGIPSAGQALLGANDLVAHCVHYLPLRLEVDPAEPFAGLLERVKAEMLLVNERQDFTFGTLLKSLRVPRDASRPTLISADFNLDPALTGLEFAGLEARYVSTPRDFARLELQFNLIEEDGELLLECDHATDIVRPETAARWTAEFESLLRAAAARPEAPVADLAPPAAPAAPAAPGPRAADPAACVHESFRARASRSPRSVALEGEGLELDYAALDAWSDDLAARLAAAGLRPGERAGLHLPRSPAMIAAELAVWKAGGVAVPMDPAHPAAKRAAIAADAGFALLLHREGEPPETELAPRLRAFAVEHAPGDGPARTAPAVARAPGDPAYVMYTSGSTGAPKGVEVGHGALANVLLGFASSFGARADEPWMAVTTPTFDISLVETFVPLTVGARVVIAPGVGAIGGAELLALARARRVRVVQATPSTWHMLLDAGLAREDGLRAISGGEALKPALAARLAARTSELWNVYGPTEAAVWATLGRIRGDEDPVPIGAPLPGYGLHVLDEDLRPVADGETGELCISGAGLAAGYVGRADETARAFRVSPHLDGGRTRLYRTGDLGRRLPDGRFVCFGRKDHQFKLRGHRVEAGEIESALERQPGVAQAVVGLRPGPAGEDQLIAWILPRDGGEAPRAERLRAALAELLPRALLPQHFEAVRSFPLNAAGKVDRAALRVSAAAPAPDDASDTAGATEELLLRIWRELLADPEVGPEDDFFLRGGSSLLANRMLVRLEERLGVQLALDRVFRHPTVRELAATVDAMRYRRARDSERDAGPARGRKETRL